MLTREVLENGKVVLELLDGLGEVILAVTIHQPGGERLLHAHLFQWLDEREELLVRGRLPADDGGAARVLELRPGA